MKMTVLHVATQPKRSAQRLSDFHTVGGGWIEDWKADKNNLRAKMHAPKKAGDGSPFGTVITHRDYLTDTRFIVLLKGETSLLEQCAAALENPKWGVWFGRKCCIPAAPLLPTLAPSQEEALKKSPPYSVWIKLRLQWAKAGTKPLSMALGISKTSPFPSAAGSFFPDRLAGIFPTRRKIPLDFPRFPKFVQ